MLSYLMFTAKLTGRCYLPFEDEETQVQRSLVTCFGDRNLMSSWARIQTQVYVVSNLMIYPLLSYLLKMFCYTVKPAT